MVLINILDFLTLDNNHWPSAMVNNSTFLVPSLFYITAVSWQINSQYLLNFVNTGHYNAKNVPIVLPFLLHLFVSPEINKSHSNASLDFSMHLPHTPWNLTEAYWYFSSRSCQLIFNFFFFISQNVPKDSLSSCSAQHDRFLPRCCPHCPFLVLHVRESH